MTAPVPRTPREEVRRRLLDAAAEVFARHGYEGARLDEIAHAAGFTKGAVYSNFDGKHALLAELVARYARTQLAAGTDEVRDQASPDDPESSARDVADVIARRTVEEGTWSRLVVEFAQRAVHDPEVRRVYTDVRRTLRDELGRTLLDGLGRQGATLAVPVERLALTLGALRIGLAIEHGADPHGVDRDTVAQVFADTLRGAVSRPAPLT